MNNIAEMRKLLNRLDEMAVNPSEFDDEESHRFAAKKYEREMFEKVIDFMKTIENKLDDRLRRREKIIISHQGGTLAVQSTFEELVNAPRYNTETINAIRKYIKPAEKWLAQQYLDAGWSDVRISGWFESEKHGKKVNKPGSPLYSLQKEPVPGYRDLLDTYYMNIVLYKPNGRPEEPAIDLDTAA